MNEPQSDNVSTQPVRTYPPADDEMNLYNAPERIGATLWAQSHPEEAGADPYLYINTGRGSEFFGAEHYWLRELAYDKMREYLESIAFPVTTETGDVIFDEEIFAFRGEIDNLTIPIDLTMQTPLMDPAMYSAGLIRHIQATVLSEYPAWRLRVVGTVRDGEKSLMIYPDAVCVGDVCCPPHELEPALQKWREQVESIREKKDGAQRRQSVIALRRVPRVVSQMADSPVVLVAAFDHSYHDTSTHTIWILRGRERDQYCPINPEARLFGEWHPIRPDGTLSLTDDPVPRRDVARAKGPYELTVVLLDADAPHDVAFRKHIWDGEREELRLEGPEYVIHVPPDELISQELARELIKYPDGRICNEEDGRVRP